MRSTLKHSRCARLGAHTAVLSLLCAPGAYAAGEPTPQPVTTGCVAAAVGGGEHSLALTKSGTVWAWGSNATGNLGDGSTTNSHVPVAAVGLAAIQSIGRGRNGLDHVIVLAQDGTVWTWGRGSEGQLGHGSATDSPSPTQVKGLKGIVAVAGGEQHSHVLDKQGAVWSFGANTTGQLGDGTLKTAAAPVRVKGIARVAEIAGGGSAHCLALQTNGMVFAWGSNADGQLGNGATGGSSNVPVKVVGLPSPIVHVAAGSSHSLAIDSRGRVWAWGSDSSGQLGDGRTAASGRPALVVLPESAAAAVAVAAGDAHSIALLADGKVFAWGSNEYGQLGNGTKVDSLVPVEVGRLDPATGIGAGNNHSLAVGKDGTLWSWGANGSGQLGDGTTTTSDAPVRVVLDKLCGAPASRP